MEGLDHVVDRISDLPCSVLTDILSFLPTEEAVQTCILSKRWINVWASLPVLKFDNCRLCERYLSFAEFREREAKFMRFLNGVLNHREILPLDMFKFSWWGYNHDKVLKLLNRVAEFMPRVISICTDTNINLPDWIFTSGSLEEMSLSVRYAGYFDCIEPKLINLPSLKKLELGDMNINDNFIAMLFSGCPLLEELVMTGCRLEFGEISSDKLKKLVLAHCKQHGEGIQISCPGVVSLHMECYGEEGFTFKNMSSLVIADLSLRSVVCPAVHDLKFLGGLSNVTNLRFHRISRNFLDIMLQESSNCSAFNNLTSLTLEEFELNLVDWFLQHSPNLKKLTLHLSPDGIDYVEEEFVRAVSCQREYLETLEIITDRIVVWHISEEKRLYLACELVFNLGALVKKIGRISVSRFAKHS